MIAPPKDVQAIGNVIAILWQDGREDYFSMEKLRAYSPSAENTGELDLFGRRAGGEGPREHPGVEVTGWQLVGNYALRFNFSDGHNTGLYSFQYLRDLGEILKSAETCTE